MSGRATFALVVALGYAVAASAWIVLSDLALAAFVTDVRAATIAGAVKGFGFVAITSALLYVVLRKEVPGAVAESTPTPTPQRLLGWGLGVLIVALVVSGLAGSVLLSSVHERHEIERLRLLAESKAVQVASWLRERRRNAELISRSSVLQDALRQWRGDEDALSREVILGRLESLRDIMNYETVLITDGRGEVLLGVGEHRSMSPPLSAAVRQAQLTGELQFTDIYRLGRDATHLHMDLVAPVRLSGDDVGLAVVLRLNQADFLLPFLQDWAVTTETGETLLVRRDGEALVVLNRLSLVAGASTSSEFVVPADEELIRAIAAGRADFGAPLRGRDFRGQAAVAVAAAVPDSDWWVFVKLDQGELYAALAGDIGRTALVLLLMVLIIIATGFLWLQRQQLSWARARESDHKTRLDLEEDMARERNRRLEIAERYQALIEQARDIILTSDASDRIVQVNRAAVTAYGWDRASLLEKTLGELRAAEPSPELDELNRRAGEMDGVLYETTHVRRDGTTFPVEASCQFIEIGGEQFHQYIIRDIGFRKASERKLDANARLLGLASEMARIGGWEVDLERGKVTWSDEVCRIHDVPPGAVVDLADGIKYYVPECRQRITELFTACATAGVAYDDEFEILSAHGRRVWVRAAGQAVKDDTGRIVRVQGAFQDITEAKCAEDVLRDRDEQLNLLIEYTPASVAMFDHEMRYIATSRRWRKTYGRGELEVPGRSHYEVFPEIGEERRAAHTQALAGEVVRAEADPMDFSDGSTHWFRWEIRPWLKADRSVGGIIILSEDITTQRENQARLVTEARRAKGLLELPVAAEKLDELAFMQRGLQLAENLTDSNIAFVHFVHKDQETIELGGWSRLTLDDYCTANYDSHYPISKAGIWADALRRREPTICNDYASYPGKQWLPEGHAELCRMASVPVIENGLVVMLMGVGNKHSDYTPTDIETVQLIADQLWRIAQKRRIDKELLEYRDRLEELVHQRTLQLEEARGRAEAASLSKSAFLANMSHEIRTPLNAIVGLVHILSAANPSAEQLQKLEKVETAAQHLLSIVSDILDISKIEAGKFVLDSCDFHLSAVLDHVCSMVSANAREKGLTISIDPDGVPHWLRGDPARLRQALLNLAGNAVKFTDKGAIALRATLLAEDAEGLRVRFEVEDTGIGIAAERVGQLFQAFEQGDTSVTRDYGGTGLGLMVTRRLAQLMGGRAGVNSELGVGSLFWFEVCLSRGRGVRPGKVALPEQASTDPEAFVPYRNARILLVEDNPVNREVAEALLYGVGLSVECAVNGLEAVEKVTAQPYDLVLMDVQMPRMDGFTATRRIRELPGRGSMPILAMTANVFAEDRRQAVAAGMNDFIGKPVQPESLYQTLLHWLRFGANPTRTDSGRPGATDAGPRLSSAFENEPASDQAAGQAAEVPPLHAIEGLDAEATLEILNGDVDAYLRLVRQFLRQHADEPKQMRVDLAQSGNDALRRRAHSVKGAAASLGAHRIAAFAAELEQAAHAETIAPTRLDSLLGGLAEALAALTPFADAARDAVLADAGRTAAGTSGDVGEVLRQLEALLATDDTAVVTVFERHRHSLAATFGETVEQFGRYIDEFDFPAALHLLQKMRR